MKKYAILLVALATTLSLLAQDRYNRYMNVYVGGELVYQKPVTEIDEVTFPLLLVEPLAPPIIYIPSGTLTVPQANAICSTLGNGETSTTFYVKGWVKEIKQEADATIRTFYIAEKMYADSTFGDATFLASEVHYLNNRNFYHEVQLAVGDYVVLCGSLTNDNGTYRTVGNGQAYVYNTSNNRVVPGKIDITDNSIADWDELPAEHVYSCVGSPDAIYTALTSMKVYSDATYINLLVEFDEAQIIDREWPGFHIFFDVDNSDATGGFGDFFSDANTDIMLETAVFFDGEPNNYDPAVFKWWGEVGGTGWLWTDPSVTHDGADFWGAVVGEGQGRIGKSQIIGNKIEIQLLRENIPFTFAETFGVGVEIEQVWVPVGVLPNAAADAQTGAEVLAPKLKVTTHY